MGYIAVQGQAGICLAFKFSSADPIQAWIGPIGLSSFLFKLTFLNQKKKKKKKKKKENQKKLILKTWNERVVIRFFQLDN
jgi:hypothetical protein